jgi:hypothetical protein
MPILHIRVEGKTATYAQRDGAIVCGNSDYQIYFTFDDDWAGYANKTARFIWGGRYFDVDFEYTGNTVAIPVPVIDDANDVIVGLYVENSNGAIVQRTTTQAHIPCVPSVLSNRVKPHPETGEHYSNEAKQAAVDARASAETAEAAAVAAGASEEAALNAKQATETAAGSAVSAATRAETAAGQAETAAGQAEASATAAQAAMTSKLDKVTTHGPYRVYGVDPIGGQTMIKVVDVGQAPAFGHLPLYVGNGQLVGNEATADKHLVPLSQMKAAIAEVSVKPEVDVLRKRVTNLEQGITPDPYHEDSAVAFAKTVPENALPYAQIDAVGGMTYRVPGSLDPSSTNLFNLYAVAEDMGLTVNGEVVSVNGAAMSKKTVGELFPSLEVGKTYTISYDASMEMQNTGSLAPLLAVTIGYDMRPDLGSPQTFVVTAEMLNQPVGFYAQEGEMNFEMGYEDYVARNGTFSNIMLNEGYALPYEPPVYTYITRNTKVTAVESVGANKETLNTFAIPAEVQALDGYGWGLSADVYNGIEWDENGKATFVKRVGRTTFNGTESWWNNTIDAGFYVARELADVSPTNKKVIASRMTSGAPSSVGTPCVYFSDVSIVIFPGNLATTAAEWKAKLAEWAAAGDPLTMYYALATPVVTDISHLVTADNFIGVEPGGTITVQNERGDAAPSTGVYQLKPTEV